MHEVTRRITIPAEPGSWYTWPRYTFEPTGNLRVQLEHYISGVPKTIRDGKRQRLEERLNEVVVAIITAAAVMKERRLAREAGQKRWAEERARKEEARRQEALEMQRRKTLVKLADDWDRGNRVRAFLTALRDQLGDTADEPIWATFIAWAEEVVALLDPLDRFDPTRGPAGALSDAFDRFGSMPDEERVRTSAKTR